MEEKQLICVNCPKGCHITVTLEGKEVVDVKGFSCPQGKAYATQETIRPKRVLTSTITIHDGTLDVLPVITSCEIPLDLFSKAMEEIRKIEVKAPIKMNDVIVSNFLDTGANLLAERSIQVTTK